MNFWLRCMYFRSFLTILKYWFILKDPETRKAWFSGDPILVLRSGEENLDYIYTRAHVLAICDVAGISPETFHAYEFVKEI